MTMNNEHTIQNPQTEKNLPNVPFQWEQPVLYTEEWLKTLAGGITDLVENAFYHT